MGLDARYPAVRGVAPDETFPVYSEDGVVLDRTTGMNVTCFLPMRPGAPACFRTPPWPPFTENHRFALASDVFVLHQDHPIPHGIAMDRSRFVLADLGADQGWRTDGRLRVVADVTGDGCGDIVAFGDDGVWVARGDGAGGFAPPTRVLEDFGRDAGGWDLAAHPRFVVDVTGNRCADIVGFGDDGVWVALADGTGGFESPHLVLADFGRVGGGWDSTRHLRVLADLTGDGCADIVGFGQDSVWVALADGAGGFGPTRLGVPGGFAFDDGWRTDVHVRALADLTGDGRPDIVGFGDDGVWVASNDGSGHFGERRFVLAEYGVNQGWSVATRPRLVADVSGDGRADLVGFREDGVLIAPGDGSGGFGSPTLVLPFFGSATVPVAWDPVRHPRLAADLTGSGGADLLGFAEDGAWALVLGTDGPLGPQLVVHDFGAEQAWRPEVHLRVAADLTGDGRADIVGFGDAGVWVSRNLGEGPRPPIVLSPA
ncbi:FG-GAP repeat domain-containing protein [Mumia sp. Pv 4-285]|uniref:FG-GAP repeat domain-containing protein n=1 Tax=Mumia qirimensis TaxID=3234852 RepID=UPI00351D2764